MPVAELWACAGRTPKERRRLLCGVRDALADAFSVPPEDIYLFYRACGPEDCLLPEPRTAQLVVTVRCFPGRTPAQKERLYRLLHENLRAAGEGAQPLVVLEEPPLTNWGMPGGESAARQFGEES